MNQRPSIAKLPRKRMTFDPSALAIENPVGPALMLPAETNPGASLAVPALWETAAVAPCTAVDGDPGTPPVVMAPGGVFGFPGCPAACCAPGSPATGPAPLWPG